ncbi:DUF2167 domain-containing protein [Caulobacter sp. 17J65-9]|uniref:DUF2167 domain-containing protein n=1 Tax=Caulobacter sp. 17J65-9 TaxID=2709382 RepID=UPI0013CBEF58|nr:DUF2167 domain-containing protein [Caulobacter sp. 17J65-9]NEX93247.1 DUF2167 domain-containing protein [Caulobacter sp. 17J65-9]
MSRTVAAAALAAAFVLSSPAAVFAAAPEAAAEQPKAGAPDPAAEAALAKQREQAAEAFLKSLTPRHGVISLGDAEAELSLTDKYYFLDAADAKKVIVEAWGNPPGSAEGVLGMIFAKGTTPLDDAWGAVVTYEAEGYVSDKDAHKINPKRLLKDMQSGEDAENKARKDAGYEPTHVVGWAETPSYDATRHALIWAKEISFGTSPDHTLNYDVRLLGRRGVLSLNVVAGMKDLASVRTAAEGVRAAAAFKPGARYGDYQEGVDKKAAYGVTGLLAAGLGLAAAKKFGLLAGGLLLLKKFAAVIMAGLAGVGAWFRNLFRKREA